MTVVRAVQLEIQMVHDGVMAHPRPDIEERRSGSGIVIPPTAEMAYRRLVARADQHEVEVQGESHVVMPDRDIHAIASAAHTGLYL